MAKSKLFVYSTLANSNLYTDYVEGPNGLPREGETILIRGGAGVANRMGVAPFGVKTPVTAEQVEKLKKNEHFVGHTERGFLKIVESDEDEEKVAGDMTSRDESAQLVESDYEEDKAPKQVAEDAPTQTRVPANPRRA